MSASEFDEAAAMRLYTAVMGDPSIGMPPLHQDPTAKMLGIVTDDDDGLYDCGLCGEVFYSETEPALLALNGYPAVVCPTCDALEVDE